MDRWQGAFATANHAGIACATALVAVIAVLAARKPEERTRFPDGILLWIVALAAACGLVASQSRAGIASALAVWLMARCPGGRVARAAVATAIASAVGWLLMARGGSALPGGHDVSTIHHLRLWSDACGVAYANPVSGCGWGDFGRLWQEWLEPASWKFGFTSALSMPLTLIAEVGFPIAFPLLVIMAIPMSARAETPCLKAARAAWTTAILAGFTCSLQRDVLTLGLLACIGTWWVVLWSSGRSCAGARGLLRPVAVSAIAIAAFCATVALIGRCTGDFAVKNSPGHVVGTTLEPKARPIGAVVAIRSLGSGPIGGKTVLADCARAGWKVLVIDQLPEPDAIRAVVEPERGHGDLRIVVSGPASQVVPPELGAAVIYVDPWFGASDPPAIAAPIVRSSDHPGTAAMERAVLEAVIAPQKR